MSFIREAIIPIGGLIFAIVLVVMTNGLPPESTIFPRTILFLLFILTLVIVLPPLISAKALKDKVGLIPKETYVVAGLTALYVAGFTSVGFVPASIPFIILGMRALGQSWRLSIISAVLVTAAIYGLFVLILGLRL